MQKVIAVVFFLSWLLCGCAVEKALDDWRALLIVVVAIVVCVVVAVLMGGEE